MERDGTLRLSEWDRAESRHPSGFGDDTGARELAARLTASRILAIRELHDRIEVETYSRVGAIRCGELNLVIRPKIAPESLAALFAYAYKSTSVEMFGPTSIPVGDDAILEMLIRQYLVEVRQLVVGGLVHDYVRTEEILTAPRGRILFEQIVGAGGLNSASVPCRHYRHTADSVWNRAVLAGCRLCLSLSSNRANRSSASALAQELQQQIRPMSPGLPSIDDLLPVSNRRFKRYEPALRLLQIFAASRGALVTESDESISLPGFLFDMNLLWQNTLERLLEENAPANTRVLRQHSLHNMFVYETGRKREHVPKPDFAWMEGARCLGLLDAKYRDLSVNPLGRDMLYQLAIYAFSQAQDAMAVALYPCQNAGAREERIRIAEPVHGGARAHIVLRPVNTSLLVRAISAPGSDGILARRALAKDLLAGASQLAALA